MQNKRRSSIAKDKENAIVEKQLQDHIFKEQLKAEEKLNEYYTAFVKAFQELCIKAVSNALYLEIGGKKQLKGSISVKRYKTIDYDDNYRYTAYLCGNIYKPLIKKTFLGSKFIWNDCDGVDTSILLYRNMTALKLFSTPKTCEKILQDSCDRIFEKTALTLMIKNIIPTVQFDDKGSKSFLGDNTDVETIKLGFTFTF